MRDLSKPVRRVTFPQVVQIVRSRDTLQSVVCGPAIHPSARMQILKAWHRTGWSPAREHIGDDDLWFAALRKLLPSYSGGDALHIFRGQIGHEPVGMSWTISPVVAERFAFYGTSHKATIERMQPRPGGVVLDAMVRAEIICAAYTVPGGYYGEGEVVIDPRGIQARETPL
jgi:hypothetical protein